MYLREADDNVGQTCTHCHSDVAMYRCFDCLDPPVLCNSCIISLYRWSPFHCIDHWTGTFFSRTTLCELGLVVHIGHHGNPCPNSSDSPTKMTVVHTAGVQPILIRYCGCTDKMLHTVEHPLQLWQAGLWPAMYTQTQTIFTQHVLRDFHQISLQAKISAYNYIAALKRLTNNAFTHEVKVSGCYAMMSFLLSTILRTVIGSS